LAGAYDEVVVPNQVDGDQKSSPIIELLVLTAVIISVARY
jgi:multisubunit Na+/H+ antiporter MnhC subunit